jgi:hypothetical protein
MSRYRHATVCCPTFETATHDRHMVAPASHCEYQIPTPFSTDFTVALFGGVRAGDHRLCRHSGRHHPQCYNQYRDHDHAELLGQSTVAEDSGRPDMGPPLGTSVILQHRGRGH